MYLTKNMVERLISDLNLRLDIAKELQIYEQNIRANAVRNGKNNVLTGYQAVTFLLKQTGLQVAEIITKNKD